MNDTISDRIDVLPLNRELWRILLLAGVAWLIESYDIGIIGNALPALKRQYTLSSFTVGLMVAASTLGIVAAVLPGGWLTDRIGRKPMLVAGTAWYALFTLATGFVDTPHAIIALRFVAGFGMGAIFPIPYTLAAEFTPRRFRGAMTGMLDAFLSVGYFTTPLIAALTIPRLAPDTGWRWLFYLGGVPLLYIPVLLRGVPESPRWLVAHGRADEAERIVAKLEQSAAQRRTTASTQPVDHRRRPPAVADATPGDIFRSAYRRRTVMLWIAFPCLLFVFYAVQTYTPTVLVDQGYGLGSAFKLTALIVAISIPGKIAEAYAVERFGRKATIIWFGVLSAVGAVVFGFSHSIGLTVFAGALLSFFGVGVDPAIKIYSAEQYPTAIRETGVGFVEGVGRLLGGALAPFIMAFVLGAGGVAGSYLFVAGVALVGAAAVGVLGTETRGQRLETAGAASAPPPATNREADVEIA